VHRDERPTLPPPPPEVEGVREFEQQIAERGEWDARLTNVLRNTRIRATVSAEAQHDVTHGLR
jgi:hypothetical protein